MKSFRPYDPRIRLDAVSYKKIRDIQRWTGEKLNTETVRVSVDSRWQHLKEEADEIIAINKRDAALTIVKKVRR